MAAALRLARAGVAVTLVERRPYLGGRAYSFTDPETGQQVDNGQHVFLGCCTAYRDFLQEIGSLDMTVRQKRLRVEVRSPNGKRGTLAALPLLPAPLHLLPSLLRYPHIGLREKARAALALLAMRRERDRDRPALRQRSLRDWLRARGQSERAIAAFWDVIVVPALNDSSADVSASAGIMLFQEALLRNRDGANIGYAKDGLSALMGGPAQRRLEELGATVLTGKTAEALVVENGRFAGARLAGGETLRADACVSALPPDAMLRLLPDEWRAHPAFAPAETHEWSPIVNLHIWWDRPVMDCDFAAFVDSPAQWVFNKSSIAGEEEPEQPARGRPPLSARPRIAGEAGPEQPARGRPPLSARSRIAGEEGQEQRMTVSLSAAWDFWPMSKEELRAAFLPELRRLFPAARDANATRFIVVKERRATFRSLPNPPDNRLPAVTPIGGFFLAGDWTATGWPSTMESAARSGAAAADAALRPARAG